jgi:hypothetical protein
MDDDRLRVAAATACDPDHQSLARCAGRNARAEHADDATVRRIGVPIDPHWDLSAYDIRQQGAASDPGDARLIRVRLSIANRAARAQPVPLLRLTLLDRYGKPIAARDLTPLEYWPHGSAHALFAAAR